MLPSRRDPRTIVAAAAMALMAPAFALAQQPSSAQTPPLQIGNHTDYKALQPTTSEVCGSGGKQSVDCSSEDAKALEEIRRQLDVPKQAQPDAGSTTPPPSGTR